MINSIKLRDGLTRKNCCFVEEDFGWKFTSGEKNDFFQVWILNLQIRANVYLYDPEDSGSSI